MPQAAFSEKDLSLHLVPEVYQICKPFCDRFKLTYFQFTRHFKDESRIILTTAPAWNLHYYNHGFYNWDKFDKKFDQLKDGYVLWDSWDQNNFSFEQVGLVAEQTFNLARGLSIINCHKTHSDEFGFCGDKNNQELNQAYLTQRELFDYFILYFYRKAETLIKKLEAKRFFLPNPLPSRNKAEPDTYVFNLGLNKNIITQKIDTTLIKLLFELTPRQQTILHWLLLGKTSIEISIILNISSGTMEKHIAALKQKFQCHTLFQLGVKVKGCGLEKFLEPQV